MTTDAKPAYRGSLDPFEDISAQLREMGVCFTLTVQILGQDVVHAWHNMESFDDNGCLSATKAMGEMVSNARAVRAKNGGGAKS